MVTCANQYKHDLTAMVETPSTLVFYYAAAACLGAALTPNAEVTATQRLCSAAWARAGRPELAPDLEPMGAVSFLNHALNAERVISVSDVGVAHGQGGDAFLIELCQAPTAELADDWLALVMAAAALELSVAVHVSGPATALLEGPEASRWQQLEAHDLARVIVSDEPPEVAANQCWLRP